MPKKTITKAALAEYIGKRTDGKKFDPKTGWAQVNGKGEDANRAYGAWEALLELAEEFDLDLP